MAHRTGADMSDITTAGADIAFPTLSPIKNVILMIADGAGANTLEATRLYLQGLQPGDARGGAALSIKQVIGQPVKFVGVGEKYDAIEPFYPDRIAQRILGMGDVLSLIEEVQGKIDEDEAQKQLEKMTSNQFTLEDFRNQLGQFKKLGSMSKLMKMLPNK